MHQVGFAKPGTSIEKKRIVCISRRFRYRHTGRLSKIVVSADNKSIEAVFGIEICILNLLIAYDIKKKIPLMYRTYRGSSIDKKSAVEFLQSRSFKGTKFIVDRGFFSKPVLDEMSKDGNCYIRRSDPFLACPMDILF